MVLLPLHFSRVFLKAALSFLQTSISKIKLIKNITSATWMEHIQSGLHISFSMHPFLKSTPEIQSTLRNRIGCYAMGQAGLHIEWKTGSNSPGLLNVLFSPCSPQCVSEGTRIPGKIFLGGTKRKGEISSMNLFLWRSRPKAVPPGCWLRQRASNTSWPTLGV